MPRTPWNDSQNDEVAHFVGDTVFESTSHRDPANPSEADNPTNEESMSMSECLRRLREKGLLKEKASTAGGPFAIIGVPLPPDIRLPETQPDGS
jgi:hypothetical protein